MKSLVLNNKAEFSTWCANNYTFGDLEPTHYPCVVITDSQGTLMTVVYYSEFQTARYITTN